MSTVYSQHVSTRVTPQSEPIHGKQQVANSAGGYSFAVDCWKRLERFLILGAEGGSYYATERNLTQESAQAVRECYTQDAARTIRTIVDISVSGRAPKNDPAIFALAMLSRDKMALEAMPKVCRTGTHLFQFVDAARHFRGRGRAFQTAVRRWYLEKEPRELSYQMCKYQSRGKWSHRDLLRLTKPRADEVRSRAFAWATGKDVTLFDGLEPIAAFEHAKRATSANEIVRLIEQHDLVRECIPTQFLNDADVWNALLHRMPMTAMIRNLGKMSSVGLLKPMSAATRLVAERLRDSDRLKKARVHPIALLLAQSVYKAGRGVRGSLSWNADSCIIDALDDAFYLAFDNVVPCNKRHLLGVDVSGSMTCGGVGGTHLTPREASAAMAMLSVRTEPLTHTMAFSHELMPVALSKRMRLDTVIDNFSRIRMGRTDCSLPMQYALQNRIEADVFVILTDSETWYGKIHPCQALQQYREQMGIPAKLIVVAMVSNGFTIAAPDDVGMLDVVGFDAAAPTVMADFARQ